MAKLDDCIDKAVAAKIIRQDDAEEIFKGEGIDAINYAESYIMQKELQVAREAIVYKELKDDIFAHPKGPFVGLMSTMVTNVNGYSEARNVATMATRRANSYFAQIPELLSILRTRNVGLSQDKESVYNLIKAMYGEDVADVAIVDGAKKLTSLFERVRTDFNKLGGAISDNKNWTLPQPKYDGVKIRALAVNREDAQVAFRQKMKELIDDELTVSEDGTPLTPLQLDKALDDMFETVVTGGINKLQRDNTDNAFSTSGMGKKLANKHNERRFIYYKDADSWIKANELFGGGDAHELIVSHIEGMAHEIALLERFGPNPNKIFGTFRTLLELEDKQPKDQWILDATWNQVSGKVDPNAQPAIGHMLSNGRNIITMSTLGSAFLSSVLSDPLVLKITSNYNKIPSVKLAEAYTKLLNPANEEHRILAARAGFIMDSWTGAHKMNNRFSELEPHVATGKLTEAVMRASLLPANTESWKVAFQLTYAGQLADEFNIPYKDLDPKRIRAFKSVGITEADWDKFRTTELLDPQGARIADVTQEGGEKFHEMILKESQYAVIGPDDRTRAMLQLGTVKGSLANELLRTFFTPLKGFPVAILQFHGMRMATQTEGAEKAGYLASMILGGMVVGGLTIQLKDIAAGRNPRPVDGRFLVAALSQSGGLGIFGDYIFADKNRFGTGIANTIVGPAGELLDKAGKLTVGNVQEALAGEDTGLAGEIVDFGYRYSPKVWWARPIQNALQEQLQLMIDDGAQDKFNRIIKSRKKEYNQDYWWSPGDFPQ